jgi:hypothetical protein
MPQAARALYQSANGDTWSLVRDDTSGNPQVLHQPNQASGGQVSRIGIGDFMTRDPHGPQHAALLSLIGTLLDRDTDG